MGFGQRAQMGQAEQPRSEAQRTARFLTGDLISP